MIRIAAIALIIALTGCVSYPDLRPTLPLLDRALERCEKRISTPTPAKNDAEQAELDKSDLALIKQARRTIAAAKGAQ